jgi:5'-AMP-activated protein kinase catalytic alpha subunit
MSTSLSRGLTPLRIDDYDFQNTLGGGSFSIVKSGIQRSTGRQVAIKIISKNLLQQSELQSEFTNELQILTRLRHPQIVEFIAHLEDRTNHYLVMELCPNGTLIDHVIRNSKLSETESRGLMFEILTAIADMHSINIVHRDIKPDNIFLDAEFHAKVGDFGLSRFVEESELLKTRCGTITYVAPEIVNSSPYNGYKADVWSCGVLLYVMVTGAPPWSGNSGQIAEQIRYSGFCPPKFVSPACRDLICKMMCGNPDERLKLSEAIEHSWITGKMFVRGGGSFTQIAKLESGDEEMIQTFTSGIRRQEIGVRNVGMRAGRKAVPMRFRSALQRARENAKAFQIMGI